MPRKVKYGLDYDDGYDDYDDYDYDHEVKGDGYNEDSKCHLFHYFGKQFNEASFLVILPRCCSLLPTTFLILTSFSKYFLFGLHITTWNRCSITAG